CVFTVFKCNVLGLDLSHWSRPAPARRGGLVRGASPTPQPPGQGPGRARVRRIVRRLRPKARFLQGFRGWFESRAICVCSAVRVVPVALPRSLTSLKAAAYAAVSSAGGAPGRNCEPLVIAKGVTDGHCGASAGRKAGGVGCQLPGSVPGV